MAKVSNNINWLTAGRVREDFSVPAYIDMKPGLLYPIYSDPLVMPGDTWQMKVSGMIRALPMVNPPMGELEISFHAFFVPWRIIWNESKQFFGENDTGAWSASYSIPYPFESYEAFDEVPERGESYLDSFAAAIGLPVITFDSSVLSTRPSMPVSATLEKRAYLSVYNYYFRNQNVEGPILFTKASGQSGATEGDDYLLNDKLLSAMRNWDVFTGVIPQPQKGPAVTLPLGSKAAVKTSSSLTDTTSTTGLKWRVSGSSTEINTKHHLLTDSTGTAYATAAASDNALGNIIPANLYADLSTATAATINDLRKAIVLQQFYETLARNGSRYREVLESVWNVHTSEAFLDDPEYLGEIRRDLNINAVTSTNGSLAAGTNSGQLGRQGGKSETGVSDDLFTYTAREHGVIQVIAVIRVKKHVYSQVLDRRFMLQDLWDIYNPLFAGTGDVPVYKANVYFPDYFEDGDEIQSVVSDVQSIGDGYMSGWDSSLILGYQEYGWFTRFKTPKALNGLNVAASSLQTWTMSEYFSTAPSLNTAFMKEDPSRNIDRVFVDQNQKARFICAFDFHGTSTRVMRIHNQPGLTRI